MSYAELAVTTNYSFLRGASHPGQFVEQAAHLGYAAIGIADRNSLAGVVRAYEAWKKLDERARPRLLIGARLVFRDGTPDILAYPKDREAYGRLCQLLSLGKSARAQGRMFSGFRRSAGISRRTAADRDASRVASGQSQSGPGGIAASWAPIPGWRLPCSIPAKTAAA